MIFQKDGEQVKVMSCIYEYKNIILNELFPLMVICGPSHHCSYGAKALFSLGMGQALVKF